MQLTLMESYLLWVVPEIAQEPDYDKALAAGCILSKAHPPTFT